MRTLLYLLLLSAVCSSVLTGEADATLFYSNDFQSGAVGSEWSASRELKTETVPNNQLRSWGTFLGQFTGNDYARLSLSGLPTGKVTLSFDSYFIRSWDGNADTYGPDTFKVSLGDGTTLLDATFSNGNPAGQSYLGNGAKAPAYADSANSSMTGSDQQFSLGYWFWDGINKTEQAMDSVYKFSFSFETTGELEVIFSGENLQGNLVTGPNGENYGYYDESWGLDNVALEVTPVPEPGTLLLLSVGMAALALGAGRRSGKA